MKQSIFLSVIAGSVGLPTPGCYYFKLPTAAMDVQAQIEVTGPSTLDFQVYIDSPALKIENELFQCPGEKFVWDEEYNQLTVGEEPVSACLASLQTQSRNAVKLPVDLTYDADSQSIQATFVSVPVTLNKIDVCKSFEKSTSTVSPDDGTTTVGPTGASDESTTSTKGFQTVGVSAVLLLAIAAAF